MNEAYRLHREALENDRVDQVEKRSGVERRRRDAVEWPVLDDAGESVVAERRNSERRVSA